MVKVAIFGVGTVGESVIKILQENREIIKARSGKEIVPAIGVVKNLNKKRSVNNIELTDSYEEALNRNDIDIVVELMGGVDEPLKIV